MTDTDALKRFDKAEINDKGFSRNHYETPPEFFRKVNEEFDFAVDLAAAAANAKCRNFITEEENALQVAWHEFDGWLWLNPPYSPLKPWIVKAQQERDKGAKIVMLVPPVVTTKYFSCGIPDEIRFLVGRINFFFEGKEHKGNMTDSALLIFDKSRTRAVSWYTKDLDLITSVQLLAQPAGTTSELQQTPASPDDSESSAHSVSAVPGSC